ncbi:fatty acid hydroxylase [Robbsia andropogonis]|uniref:Fatty acid hydroxylase n=1 Tax=Robbsia andropogonis TaxID=28092 RepID=A0A0F5K2C8_9BURK|nr:sterol desaturase family protein [Robbsia andropogonis]KKB63702.1 fatty acid hydroxylase [Robbsia andropogonis]MCP1119283.1 sterol desaturase family protein [Robbsia andropogonis]MCP1129123.1 sterol desaturase family protein [Robbsia andropogonis]
MIDHILTLADTAVSFLQTQLYEHVVQPLFFRFGLMGYDEDTYDALYMVIVGAIQVLLTYAVLRPLEAWRPVEHWAERKALHADVVYTWIAKLGLLNLAFFVLFQPLFFHWQSLITLYGIPNIDIDALWPGLTDQPLVSFCLYLVILDFAGYWYHRWQHKFGVWWELHAVHHSQRQMSFWNDDRNHILDTFLQAAFFALISLFIGVEPAQFVVLVAVGNFMQSVQHINARLPYGSVLERVIVSPAFHRRHHAIGYGHEGMHYGCNFGVLLPWWDMLFRTAVWTKTIEPTGIRDQLRTGGQPGRYYGNGVLAQQCLALQRIAARRILGRRIPPQRSTPSL